MNLNEHADLLCWSNKWSIGASNGGDYLRSIDRMNFVASHSAKDERARQLN